MEYVGGKTLYEVMVGFDLSGGDDRSPGTDGADALRSIGAVAEAVRSCYEAAPARGVHRDLSPNNVMVRREGGAVTHAVLVDFGQGAQPGVVTPGRKGTPQYAAPEMFGGKYYTHKYRDAPTVDVWSLGALAYLVRTGKDPFRDEVVGGNPGGEDGGMVADFKRDHPIVLPDSLLLTDEDRRLSELISRCTEYDPRRRFQSAGEVLAFVEEALGTRPAPCVTPAMESSMFQPAQLPPKGIRGALLPVGRTRVPPACASAGTPGSRMPLTVVPHTRPIGRYVT